MMQSRVDFPLSTMLFVLILSLMTASCSAMDNKTPDTKVTAFIPKLIVMEPIHFPRLFKISRLQTNKVYVVMISCTRSTQKPIRA